MLRLIIAVVVGILIGTAGTAYLLVDPSPGSLECSINEDGTITECTNESGETVEVPHDIQTE